MDAPPPLIWNFLGQTAKSRARNPGIAKREARSPNQFLADRRRAPVGEPASYKVERWDWRGDRVEETVATATLVMIGHAAFHAAVEQYPRARLTLRQGARVILKSPG